MSKRILMLGAGFMQGVAIRCARSRGWEVVAVDGNPSAPCAGIADRFVPIDLKDRAGLLALARQLQADGGLSGVFTAATDFSASVAWVAQGCGLPGHTFEAACNASDKLRMRACFEREGVPSPAFIGVDATSAPQVLVSLSRRGIEFPVVVKPVDNMGARGCRLVAEASDLGPAIADAIGYSRTGNAIVEEYMDGPEFSVEALVYDGEIHMTGVADRHIFFPPYFIEMGHTIPSAMSSERVGEIIAVFKRGVAALGLTHGVAKGDMKLTSKGAMVGEIAGRLSGGYMSGWTFPYSSGIDLTGAALDLAVGDRPASLTPILSNTSAERAWISIPGVIAAVYGDRVASTIPYIRDVFPRARVGDRVRFPLNNVEKCGNCLAVAPSHDEAVHAAESACRTIVLRLRPGDPDTDAFLAGGPSGPGAFPPDAFPVAAVSASEPFTSARLESLPAAVQLPARMAISLDSLRDWQGRTLREALVQSINLEPTLLPVLSGPDRERAVRYWNCFLRGSVQGLLYAHDNA